ncbi:glucosamine--fructose-6-phosphate aminotransferase [Planococcus glaciei]|uniref:Glutamine--fructose-6-phosphate aminotransferase [isomerizing] n=1 Tax=Planococcus glaciei TaxID=459472 RepID=A0A1G8M348_9BACL|nr:glutamine--fructose-6-phosphate transaminase (isomerizing) [Planococcus glaciei]MCP2036691.1 glucosamine--fructose-6-phosphate aminotransferase (isomerizing) [Planomicrobium sp. HSC-17F08]ETP70278.1 glucosamine--fructose-6-phosphate aminotransferase [Planococcus glaciei CHR43]KOF10960.1 glucosamine--fructose-6-phosphate aminotransferase [Planococcus glaciei]MBX0315796.1 glutamine--fructose-6-phosphate transaminase (isomerizing) [Planococcus glaciei]QKX50501.1 glutamine--fructose-6-phosphate
MCGIVGYIGENDSKEILLKGLERLEYRGYDSAGIAVRNGKGITVFKEKGRIADLRAVVEDEVTGTSGIGHTRWATHGKPNRVNAHPHQNDNDRFTLVHNGVIENYHHIQRDYLADVQMESDTDTEIIVQLIGKFVAEGMTTQEAFSKTLTLLKGSYAIALLDAEEEQTIFVAKNKSPLLVGLGDGFNVVASDAMAMLQITDQFVELMDKEIVIVRKDSVEILTLDGEKVSRQPFKAEIDMSDIEKGTYPHYMLKEIDEQPAVMRKIIQAYQGADEKLTIQPEIIEALKDADRIHIIAAGTSYHAGLIGKEYLEKMAQIPVEVHVASEFGYNMPLLSEKPLFIFISQSGETADSRQVLVKIKELGHPSLTITNVAGSTLSREADYTLLLYAGPEIAVASTKAYTAQIAVLSILAAVTAQSKGIDIGFDLVQELGIVANGIQAQVDMKEEMEQIARDFLSTTRNCFFIGRVMDYFVGLEGALKLKEISYIQAEGFAGGELKHGTIALIEEGTPVIALATQEAVNLSIRGNVKEVAARGAHPCIISMEGLQEEGDSLVLPKVHELLSPLVSVIPMQLISYYAALHRDCDVDKPRNLAKSVTVE